MTRTATRSATRCCGRSRTFCARRSATPTSPAAGAVRSSSSCCRAPTRTVQCTSPSESGPGCPAAPSQALQGFASPPASASLSIGRSRRANSSLPPPTRRFTARNAPERIGSSEAPRNQAVFDALDGKPASIPVIMPADDEHHPLFKSEEQARIEETMDGVEPDFSDASLENVGVWPGDDALEEPTTAETQETATAVSAIEESGFWGNGGARDFDWGD